MSTRISAPARSSRCSAPTAPARARCSMRSPARCPPPKVGSSAMAELGASLCNLTLSGAPDTCSANAALAFAWWGVPRSKRPGRAREALRAAHRADHLARRRAATLSGGERRRVHLARAIAAVPDVLMLDEPLAGLDAEVRGEPARGRALGAALQHACDAGRRPRPPRGVGAGRPAADPDPRPPGCARVRCGGPRSNARRASASRGSSATTEASRTAASSR